MTTEPASPDAAIGAPPGPGEDPDHLRFHAVHAHLSPAFGNDFFGATAETFARLFGTPVYLVAQSVLVAIWVYLNWTGRANFDPYPFILLNLAFSLQAAYAAPLILLAQTRQAARDKAHADADARHREDLARASAERQDLSVRHAEELRKLVEANLALTRMTRELSERIENLTHEIHSRVVATGDIVTQPAGKRDEHGGQADEGLQSRPGG